MQRGFLSRWEASHCVSGFCGSCISLWLSWSCYLLLMQLLLSRPRWQHQLHSLSGTNNIYSICMALSDSLIFTNILFSTYYVPGTFPGAADRILGLKGIYERGHFNPSPSLCKVSRKQKQYNENGNLRKWVKLKMRQEYWPTAATAQLLPSCGMSCPVRLGRVAELQRSGPHLFHYNE